MKLQRKEPMGSILLGIAIIWILGMIYNAIQESKKPKPKPKKKTRSYK